jgi:serine/threonine-protein kinase
MPVYDQNPNDSIVAHGIAAATHAIALDSTLAEAYTARASLLNASFRWADAERDYRKALSINPADAASHQGLGENLLLQGRVTDAIHQFRRAAELDPTSAEGLAAYAMALSIAGNQTAALSTARRAMSLDSTVFVSQLALGAVQIFSGHPDSALAPLEAAGSLGTRRHPTSAAVAAMLAYAYARMGDLERARAIVKQATDAKNPSAAVIDAHALLGAGNLDSALAVLQKAAATHAPLLTAESLAEPIFDPLRAKPKFLQILRTLDLPDSLARATKPAA